MLDHDIQIVRVSVEEGRALSWDEQNSLSGYGMVLASQLPHLSMIGDVMGIKLRKQWRPILPRHLVTSTLEELHGGYGGGHFGISKLKEKVEKRFWWPDYIQDLRSFVMGCPTCGKCKSPPRSPRAELQPVKVSRPQQIVGLDIVGPLSTSQNGNRYVLVMEDYFTKWVEAVALPNQLSQEIVRAITDYWITRHGVPERFHSDQGTNFMSAEFEAFCRTLRVQHSHSTGYHPEGNGQVERWNRSLKMLLRTHVTSDTRWDESLSKCLMAYRASVHESTGFSPFALMYGTSMRLPCDNSLATVSEEMRAGALYLKLKEQLRSSHNGANRQLTNSRARQKKNYDRKMHETQFSVGDAVWLYHPATSGSRKLHKPWRGPFRILEVLEPCNYRIRFWGRQSGPTQVVHHNRLKCCHDVERALKSYHLASDGNPSLSVADNIHIHRDSSSSDDDCTLGASPPLVSARVRRASHSSKARGSIPSSERSSGDESSSSSSFVWRRRVSPLSVSSGSATVPMEDHQSTDDGEPPQPTVSRIPLAKCVHRYSLRPRK